MAQTAFDAKETERDAETQSSDPWNALDAELTGL